MRTSSNDPAVSIQGSCSERRGNSRGAADTIQTAPAVVRWAWRLINFRRLTSAGSYHMGFLLTWNCRHINNRAVIRRIELACSGCGLNCPVICTPEELLSP